MIGKCVCKHDGQDALHGKGKRVFNPTLKTKAPDLITYRCTVCTKEKKIK